MEITRRFDRILRLFFVLQSRSVVSIEELQSRFDASKRTIYRDLNALQAAGVPIVQEHGVGYSIMEGYRIQPSRFTPEEILSLTIAEKVMQGHQTQFIKTNFESALTKIKGSFELRQKDQVQSLEDKLLFADQTRTTEYLPDIIDVLLKSTVTQKIAHIQYIKSSGTDAVSREIEAVGVFYQNQFWYVLAYCHLRQDYRNFRLDRIREVRLSGKGFTRKHPPVDELRRQDIAAYATRIVIHVDREFAHYLFWERQVYGYEREEVVDGHVMMYFTCRMHPTAFVRWFLKYVDIGHIAEPEGLQEEALAIVRAGLKRNPVA